MENLGVNLGANVDGFIGAFQRAAAQLAAFQNEIAGGQRRLGGLESATERTARTAEAAAARLEASSNRIAMASAVGFAGFF